ncbi:hypothetical protein ABFV05_020164 [Capra hircus]
MAFSPAPFFGTQFGNGASVLRSRAPPLSWKEQCPLLGIFRDSKVQEHPDSGMKLKTAYPTPRGRRRNAFCRARRVGRPRVDFRSKPPPTPPGNPSPQKARQLPTPRMPWKNFSASVFFFFFFNNFALGRHDLHSPARRSEPRNKRELKPHNSSAARRQRLAALRGGSHPAAMFPTREPPQNQPPPLRPALRPPSRPGRGRGAAEPLSTLPRRPLAAKSDSTAAGCAPARSAGSGRGRPAVPGRGLKRPERRGAGEEGGGPGRSLRFPPSGPPLRPRRGSHTCTLKTHFKVLFLARGRPPLGQPLGPRAGRESGPEPCRPFQNPGAAMRPGGPESGDSLKSPGRRDRPSGVRVPPLPPLPHRLQKMNGTQSLRPALRCGLRSSPLFGLILTPGPD